jgi:hypothetical protein
VTRSRTRTWWLVRDSDSDSWVRDSDLDSDSWVRDSDLDSDSRVRDSTTSLPDDDMILIFFGCDRRSRF